VLAKEMGRPINKYSNDLYTNKQECFSMYLIVKQNRKLSHTKGLLCMFYLEDAMATLKDDMNDRMIHLIDAQFEDRINRYEEESRRIFEKMVHTLVNEELLDLFLT
jgi:hypothetical protein